MTTIRLHCVALLTMAARNSSSSKLLAPAKLILRTSDAFSWARAAPEDREMTARTQKNLTTETQRCTELTRSIRVHDELKIRSKLNINFLYGDDGALHDEKLCASLCTLRLCGERP